jgi:hypothetical protein
MSITPWIKATKSADNNTCVEMRQHDGTVQLRDSKDTTGPTLDVTKSGFASWLDAAKNGEFDHLADLT